MRRSAREEAFTAYAVARQNQLLRAAYLLCGNMQQAEDLVQTTLIKLYAAWPRVSKADNVDAYARRVLVNSHKDEFRRPWRREHAVADPAIGIAARTGIDVEDIDELVDALRALPEGQRRVVVLRHYWGLSIEETAADLGVSAGTVKSQTSRALTALTRALQPHHHPTGGQS